MQQQHIVYPKRTGIICLPSAINVLCIYRLHIKPGLILLVSAHLGKVAQCIREVGSPTGWILLPPT